MFKLFWYKVFVYWRLKLSIFLMYSVFMHLLRYPIAFLTLSLPSSLLKLPLGKLKPVHTHPGIFETATSFYSNRPSVHKKPVNPLNRTGSFWNRSAERESGCVRVCGFFKSNGFANFCRWDSRPLFTDLPLLTETSTSTLSTKKSVAQIFHIFRFCFSIAKKSWTDSKF